MRTAHLLPVSPTMHCAGGGVCFRGCLLPGVCLPLGGVCFLRGCLLWGVSTLGGVSQHAMEQTPPWTDRRLWKHNLCKLRLLAVINTWQKCIPVRCIPPASMVISKGCLRGGVCVCPGGVCLGSVCVQWSVCPVGVYVSRGVCPVCVCVCVSWLVSAQGEGVCPGGVSRGCVQGCLPKGCTSSGPEGRHPPRPKRQTPPPHCMLGYTPPTHCMSVHPPVDRQTPVKILPCPKLRLRPVIILCNY